MAQQPIGLFGLKLIPGEEYDLDVFDDVRITNISFGETVVGNARTLVKIHHRSVPSFYDDEEDDSDEDSDESLSEDFDEDDESEEADSEEAEAANTSKASATKVNGTSKKEKKEQEAKEMAALMEGLTGAEGEDDEDDDEDEEDEDEEEEQTFVICSLYPGKLEQATVDLHISTEDQVRFSITGDNPVELLGSYLSSGRFDDDPDSDELIDSSDEDSDDYSDSDDEEIDSDELEMLEAAAEEDEDDEDDSSEDEFDDGEIDLDDLDEEELALLRALQDESDEDDDEDEDDEDMDDSDERFEEVSDVEDDIASAKPTAVKSAAGKKRSAAELDEDDDEDDEQSAVTDAQIAKEAKALGLDATKLTKNQRKKLNKRLRAADSSAEITQEAVEVTQKDAKDGKVKTQTAKKEEAKANGKTAIKKVTLPSGVVIEDVKMGTGAAAKAGNRLGMRYVGRLQNGKQFDANTKGKPFTFKLGKGDVIGGWDEGLKGMKVGGERRLIIPPKMGYGSRGAPPDIPGNAVLVFDVKLVEIK